MKKIVLCADDFGRSSVASTNIVKLVAAQRVSAVSCITNIARWQQDAKLLKPYADKIDIGLHFNLTEGANTDSLFKLLLKTKLRLPKRQKIITEFNYQLDQFINAIGCYPDFIDGHQHIHQLPVICDAIFQVYKERLQIYKPYLRYLDLANLVKPSLPSLGKRFILSLVCERNFNKKLKQHQILHNQSFSGIYNLQQHNNYAQLFAKFLSNITHSGLVMCHPELTTEVNYLASDEFIADCKAAQIEICRFI